jgi:glycosyltransferase involved in cell wall biosynthesis
VPAVARKSCVIPNPIDADALRAAVRDDGPTADRAQADAATRLEDEATVARTRTAPIRDDELGAVSRARPYVLFVGRMERMKDLPVLLDAFDAACAQPVFAHDLVLAGSGSLLGALRERARRSTHRERIFFLGDVEHAAALRLIAHASVLALPSKFSEGCPNVALEAMALGVPLVVSDLPSLTELVGHDGGRSAGAQGDAAGAVFPRGDAAALAARIVELARDRDLRERYARAAAVRLADRHDVNRAVERYERVYAEVTAS